LRGDIETVKYGVLPVYAAFAPDIPLTYSIVMENCRPGTQGWVVPWAIFHVGLGAWPRGLSGVGQASAP